MHTRDIIKIYSFLKEISETRVIWEGEEKNREARDADSRGRKAVLPIDNR